MATKLPTTAFQVTSEVSRGYFIVAELRDTDRGQELSIQGTTPGSGGQCRDAFAGLTTFAPGWDAAKRDHLLQVWDAWHLNGMRAGCSHQRGQLRDRTCQDCGQKWTTAVRLSTTTANLSGEATTYCPGCNGHNVISGPAYTFDGNKRITFRTYSIDGDTKRAIERARDAGGMSGVYVAQLARLQAAGIKPFTFVSVAPETLATLAELFAFVPERELKAHTEAMRQEDERYSWIRPVGARRKYKTPILVREETKTASWVRPAEHPDGILTKPCPVCQYPYGSAWRFEPLPEDVIAFVRALPPVGGAAVSPYDIQAQRFLATYGITFRAEHARAKASKWGGTSAQHWRVTLTAGRRTLSFDFWNSEVDTSAGTPLRAYSVLACLAGDNGYTDADEVAAELGVPPSQARAVVAFARRVHRFFAAIPGAVDALQGVR